MVNFTQAGETELSQNTNESPEAVLGNEMEERYISVWLMPRKKERGVLQEIVDRLAKEFGTCSFPPHLTIVSGFYGMPVEIDEAIRALAETARQGPFVFKVGKVVIGDSNKMPKTFYVTLELETGPNFEEYCQLYLGLPATHGKPSIPAPHMSLMYKAGGPAGFSEEQRARLEQVREEIETMLLAELPRITFDTVYLVTSKRTLTDDPDVLAYRTVQSYPL